MIIKSMNSSGIVRENKVKCNYDHLQDNRFNSWRGHPDYTTHCITGTVNNV